MNQVFGMYYFADREHIDQGRAEVANGNDFYGSYICSPRANCLRKVREQVLILVQKHLSNKHKKCHVNLQILQIDFHSKSRQIRHVIDFQIDMSGAHLFRCLEC